jgi:hypothetical protein
VRKYGGGQWKILYSSTSNDLNWENNNYCFQRRWGSAVCGYWTGGQISVQE